MKKLLLLFPFILSAYFYPFNYQFTFIHNCMQNSDLPNKYEYCRCVYEKIKERFPYNYFIYNSSTPEVLKEIVKFSKECR